jgi:hypothetical protein
MAKFKVKMPKWWTESKKDVIGYTDKIDTYCCCLTPSWFVEVPEFDYSGYFNIKDLEPITQ